jgi:hypothetical protein
VKHSTERAVLPKHVLEHGGVAEITSDQLGSGGCLGPALAEVVENDGAVAGREQRS